MYFRVFFAILRVWKIILDKLGLIKNLLEEFSKLCCLSQKNDLLILKKEGLMIIQIDG